MRKLDKNLRAGTPLKPRLPLLFFERMEPKILLSADALGGLVSGDPFAETAPAASLDITESISLLNESYGAGPDLAGMNLSAAANDPVDINTLAGVIDVGSAEPEGETATDLLGTLLGDVDSATASRQEIIFVDAATPDYETLLEGIADAADTDYQVVILQSGLDGINQMTRVLGEQQGIDAIHLVSHGNQQGFQLGNVWLSSDKLDAYSEQLLRWGEALDQDADLLIYGCELAADEAGRDLLNGLATFTGADVAASNDLTGAAELGGDWQLEYNTGIIESQVAIDVSTQQAWSYVLGTITVTTTLDVVDGDADLSSLAALAATPGSDGFVSLREAIIAANTDTISGLDEINLGAGTYALTLSGDDNTSAAGDLDINDALIIRGVSVATTIIDGDIPNDRVFDIRAPGADISNLTITNGGSAATIGGGLRVTTGNDVTLTDVIISNNAGNIGGGLQIINGTVTLNRVVFDGNTSANEGGAIVNTGGVVNGTDVSFISNSAATDGGGVLNEGDLTLDRALFFDNSAAVGGAIHNEGGNVTLTNATLSANTASTTGGAINNQEDAGLTPGVLDITNSTFTANTSAGANGIFQQGSSTISLVNSILDDGGSNLSGGLRTTIEFNIDSDNSAALGGGTNLVGDPMLDVLADNGGFARTHALMTGSIGINAGTSVAAPTEDQREQVRLGATDIGAYEFTAYDLVWGDTVTDSIMVSTFDGSHQTALITGLNDPASVAIDFVGGKVYWANDLTGTIERANLDGSSQQVLVSGLSGRIAIDIDIAGGKIYWTEGGGGATLDRANLDGTAPEGVVGSPSGPTGIAVNGPSDKVYWADEGVGRVKQTSLTGVGTSNLVNSGVSNSANLAIDVVNGKIYWTNTVTGDIQRANLADGTVSEAFNVGGSPYGIAIDTSGGKIYWTDAVSGEIYNANLADLSGVALVTAGLSLPADIDVILRTPSANFAPTATNLSSTSAYNEGDASVAITDIVVSDADAGDIVTATLTLADINTGSLSANDGASYTVGTGVWTFTGTVASMNTALANLVFLPNVTNDVDTSISVTIDDGNEDGGSALTGTITLDVTPDHYLDQFNATSYGGNDGSLTWSNDWQEIGEANGAAFGSVSVWTELGEQGLLLWAADGIGIWREADLSSASSATLSFDWAMMQTEAGDTVSLEISTDGGLVWAPIDTYVGPLNHGSMQAASYDISAYIDTDTRIKFETVSGFSANDKILIDNVRIDLSGSPNTATSATNLSSASPYNEGDANVAITDIVVTDADAGDIVTATLTLADITTGSLSANDGASYTAGTGVWTITGTVANVNTALANLVFNPTADNDLDTTIAVNIDDGDEDGGGALTGTITLDVTPANDDPVLGNNTLTLNQGDIVALDASMLSASDVDNADASLTFTVSNVSNGYFAFAVDTTTPIASFDQSDITAGNVRFVHDGGEIAPTYDVSVSDGTASTVASAAGTSFTGTGDGVLWLTFKLDEGAGSGIPGLNATAIEDDDVLQQAGPNFALGEAATDGNFTIAFNPSDFAGDTQIRAMHFVTNTITIGATNAINLQPGDLILSSHDTPTFTSNGAGAPGPLSVIGSDIFYFRPDTPGDYSTGNFYLLLSDPFQDGANVDGLSLVERNVTVGDANLSAGDLLLTRSGAGVEDRDVWLLDTSTLDPTLGATFPAAQQLIEGDDLGVDIDVKISGIDVLEQTETIGGQLLAAGTLLITVDADDTDGIGLTAKAVDAQDIAALTVVKTTLVSGLGNAVVNATLLFDGDDVSGNDVNVDSANEIINGFTLTSNVTPGNAAPLATNLTSTSFYTEGDGSVPITNIVVTDTDIGDVITATLTLANTATGSLSANDGASYSAITGAWTISDTIVNVNIALANLVFNPVTENDVDTTISVNIDDGDEDASGALTGTITLDVTPVNDAPLATNLSSTSPYTEGDVSVAITDIVVSDVDTGEVITATLTLANIAAGSLSANDGASYSAITGVWTITDSVANVNTALANLAFAPAANNDVDTTISVSIDDGDEDASGALTGTITLDVTPINDAPTATNLSSTSLYNEGDATVAITDIVVSDVDTGEVITATLTLANTAAGSLSANDGATYSAITGVWTITDSVANVNTALANLAFAPAANNDVDTTIGVSIDDGDEDASGALTGTITLDITPLNDAPNATNLSSTSPYNEGDASVAITDIVVSDVDTGEVITATLTLANTAAGSLSANDGASYSAVTGVWTITDTVANVNTALANLAFAPAANNDVDTTISVNIDDGDEDASGALTGTITLDVTPVNDAPNATNLSSTSPYNEGDASVAITDIVVSDVDTGEVITATLTLANAATGSLSANDGATYSAVTGVWTITDSVANVNTALANLAFAPNINNDVDTTIGVSIDDGDEDASGALTGTITLDVTPINDAPTATNLTSTSPYNEGDASVAITDIVVSDVDTGEVITATLTLANTATGSLSANDGASYSAVTGVWTITDSVANVNTALANLAFAPAANNDVDTTISVSIDDGDEDASGALTGTITLDVTPINDAPTATNLTSTSPYNEGDASVAITDIVVSDVDTGEVITATLTLANAATGSLSANDGASYSAVTGVWTITDSVANVNTALANLAFAPNTNNDVDTTIGVSIDDGDEDASGALTGTITLDVTPVNDAPTATNLSSTSPYNEGDASVAITDIVVSDVDTGEVIAATLTLANTATGSLSANDGASYSAVTGVWTITDSVANVNTALANLAFAPVANNDLDTTISVNIDDGDEDASGALTGTITLDVTPVNDAPTATNLSSTSPYNEGDAIVAITDIVVSDVDTGEVIATTLTLANTATGSLSANDGAGYSAVTGVWTITDSVANVDTALANLAFAPNTNNDVDTTIGVSIDDGDEDASGALTGTITLDVTPINDAPTATNVTGASPYNEGDASVAITNIVVSDVDTGEVIAATLTLANTATGSLSANDGASYSAVTGVWTITDSVANVNTALANLAFAPAANNDVDTTISVSIDDGDEDASGALTGTITLDVTPINDAPTATNLSSTSPYNEGDASVAITDIVVSDIDTGEIITATLTLANTAAGSLSANDGATYSAITGVWTITDSVANVNTALANLAFAPAANNDVDTTISVNIDDGDEDASGALTGTITLDVTPINDAPTATNLSSTSPYNEGDASVAITDIVVSDLDTGETITATLTLANTAAGSLSANDGATYSAITGVWTITNSVANVNTALANLAFAPNTNNDVDTTIGVSIDDGDEDASGALTGTITLDVTPINDAPTATNLSSTSPYNEGDASVAITDIVVSDIDTGEIITATLTLANTAAGSLSANDGATYSAVTGVWTFTDTVANVNTALANLVFSPVANNEVDTSISVSIDDGDEDASGALTGTITLDVTPVNDAPTATNLSSTSLYNEGDASVAITDIVVSDIDTGEIITATLTLANTAAGSLSANDGATYSAVTGVWTITDSVANVNTALANLAFAPAASNDVDTTISVNIDDGDEDASGALTGTITLDVTPINDAPTATNLSSTSLYNEGDASVAITDIVVSDLDTGETITATLTLADTSTGGLSANDGASYSAVTGVWTITDTLANVNTALANLVFNPALNNELDTSISVSIDDGDEDASGALTGTITLTVTAVNDAPTATNLFDESRFNDGDTVVPLNNIVISDPDIGETVTATLTLANINAGSLSANNGASYDAVTGLWTITGTVAQVNTALANLAFIPAIDNALDTTIAVSIDDGDEDGSGPLIGALTITLNPLPAPELPDIEVVPEAALEPEVEADEAPVEDTEEEAAAEIIPAAAAPESEDFVVFVSGDEPGLPESEDEFRAPVFAQAAEREYDKVRIIEGEKLKPAGVVILLEKLQIQLQLLNDPLQLINTESFIKRLNDMRQELVSETQNTERVVGSSLSVSAGLSVGYVIWLARSGVLLSSVLSSLPAWRFIDPLPVLAGLQSGKGDENDESLESMVEDQETDDEIEKTPWEENKDA